MKNQELDIVTLIEGCRNKNQRAQLGLYNLYYKAMYNVAYRILGNQFWAEDVMQESFLKAFDKIDTFSGNVSFGAWLKKIVINNSINELNKNKQFQFEALNEENELVETQETIDTETKCFKTEQILKTLQTLKSNYKIILTLFYIEGYDLEEIATIMKISYENSRTMFSRAKANLTNKLKTV